jgi:long-chain acyl-CoA synthetase
VVLMANCPEVLITYNAVWRAGAIVTPVVFLVTADELRHILLDAGAVVVVTTGELLATVLAAVDGAAAVRHVVVAGAYTAQADATTSPRLLAFGDLESGDEGALVERNDWELAALMYTGGTTGRAKGVALSHGNLWSCAKSLWDTSYVPGLTRMLVPLPLSHAYGMIVTVVGMHAVEPGLAVVQRWFTPGEWVSLAEQWRAERTALVPAMVQMLLGEPLEDTNLSSLQICRQRRGAAVDGRAPRVRTPRPIRGDPRGIWLHRDVRGDLVDPARATAARQRRPADPRLHRPDRGRRRLAAARWR